MQSDQLLVSSTPLHEVYFVDASVRFPVSHLEGLALGDGRTDHHPVWSGHRHSGGGTRRHDAHALDDSASSAPVIGSGQAVDQAVVHGDLDGLTSFEADDSQVDRRGGYSFHFAPIVSCKLILAVQ